MKIDTDLIKKESEARILAAGGIICDWLPYIDFTQVREEEEVIARALIMNAMLNIHFKAPTEIIESWIKRYKLDTFLSERERSILSRRTDELTAQETTDLYWYIEGLWAILWATKMIDSIDFKSGIPDHMVTLCPNLQKNENDEKFTKNMELREYDELYSERDLYYRAMWCARQWSHEGTSKPEFEMSRIMERRKALEWILDSQSDWDDIPLNT